jgi:hypothetical protein
MEDPEIALTIIIERSGHGGEIASPLARELLEVYFGDVQMNEIVLGEE